ncbi:hypothetical protein DFP72DRAFT_850682 [Ephemerocybe angulata]|uniref:Uncharacterized protein n=1 Tax=Ephemerocybe angulata TaxID=980116 RepID=A0A8H6HC86_9AGAR|nr:hypothetical protein DFP72DRAFT_859378 [Tulosesus angulatus]KAF6751561.1 hypothetical protein DFP72DRAFT_850682 [Tulosesus angulatus]
MENEAPRGSHQEEHAISNTIDLQTARYGVNLPLRVIMGLRQRVLSEEAMHEDTSRSVEASSEGYGDLSDSESDSDEPPPLSDGTGSGSDDGCSCDEADSCHCGDSDSDASSSSYHPSDDAMSDVRSDEGESGYESEDSSMFGVESGEDSSDSSSEEDSVDGPVLDFPPIVAYPDNLVTAVPVYARAGPVYAERFMAAISPRRYRGAFIESRRHDSRRRWRPLASSTEPAE